MGVYLLAKTYPTTPKKSVLYQQPPKNLPIPPAQCLLCEIQGIDIQYFDGHGQRGGNLVMPLRPLGFGCHG